jgi:hypothetical protein
VPNDKLKLLKPGVDDALISYIQDHKSYYAVPFERREIQQGYLNADTRYSEPFSRKSKRLLTRPSAAAQINSKKVIEADQNVKINQLNSAMKRLKI